jgi:hypothetical protein
MVTFLQASALSGAVDPGGLEGSRIGFRAEYLASRTRIVSAASGIHVVLLNQPSVAP